MEKEKHDISQRGFICDCCTDKAVVMFTLEWWTNYYCAVCAAVYWDTWGDSFTKMRGDEE